MQLARRGGMLNAKMLCHAEHRVQPAACWVRGYQQSNETDRHQMFRSLRQSYGLAGLLTLCVIVASIILTVQLSVAAAEEETVSGDVLVSSWVQRASLPGIAYLVEFLNWIGRPIPLAMLTGVVAIGLMSRRRYAEAILILPATGTHAVNAILKNVIQSPRPSSEHVTIHDHATGFGFPSGHTMAVVVFCGVVAYLAWRLIERRHYQYAVHACVALAVVGIGFSRIYSGAHWPSDVLGGYLWGMFYTGALVLMFHRMRPHNASVSVSGWQTFQRHLTWTSSVQRLDPSPDDIESCESGRGIESIRGIIGRVAGHAYRACAERANPPHPLKHDRFGQAPPLVRCPTPDRLENAMRIRLIQPDDTVGRDRPIRSHSDDVEVPAIGRARHHGQVLSNRHLRRRERLPVGCYTLLDLSVPCQAANDIPFRYLHVRQLVQRSVPVPDRLSGRLEPE